MKSLQAVLAATFLLAALTGCACTCGTSDSPSDEAMSKAAPLATEVQIAGISNARQTGGLLFGGQPSEEALAELARRGYKTVISTRGEGEISWDEEAKVESLGMKFVQIPMGKPLTEITDEMVAEFDEAMKSSEKPALLHCGSGNRVAGLWGVWLAEKQGLEAEAAISAAEKAGMTRLRPLVEKRLGVDG